MKCNHSNNRFSCQRIVNAMLDTYEDTEIRATKKDCWTYARILRRGTIQDKRRIKSNEQK